MAACGLAVGIPAFMAVIAAAPLHEVGFFVVGTLLVGFGAGLFGHGTLTATMHSAPKDQTGLALGAWGAVQASSAGVAIALGGIARDLVANTQGHAMLGAGTAFLVVYAAEIVFLVLALLVLAPVIEFRPRPVLGEATPLRPQS
jgi:BCD family chlorophyll transporter-like MFS transporter